MDTKKLAAIFLILVCGFFVIVFVVGDEDSEMNFSKELSPEDYKRVKEELLLVMSEQDPGVALAILRERIKGDDALARSCHAMVHAIGHEAYESFGSFGEAMKYQDELCNSGYLHGVIESHFSGTKDIVEKMNSVCGDYELGSFASWECYHGVGHGLMFFTDNDLPQSLKFCESYTDEFMVSSCANGVFMENFNVDQKFHVSKFVDAEKPFSVCEIQKSDDKADCYLYAPTYYLSLNKNDYVGGFDLCSEVERDYRGSCIRGVGSQAMKENINAPKLVEKICDVAGFGRKNYCLTGMISIFINHYGSIKEGEELCLQLETRNQEVCREVVKSRAKFFE